MPVYLVAYDFNSSYDRSPGHEARTSTRRDRFRENLLEAFPEAHRLSESAYAVDSTMTVEELADHVGTGIESQDEVYVLSLRGPLWGHGQHHNSSPTLAWLAGRLGR